ncbi:hypothetical protein KJ780_04035 [Candidatus Micrarchaeota archaeon]|nr:hypothetical protein [Candidatus Micrarchaeota archaeon]
MNGQARVLARAMGGWRQAERTAITPPMQKGLFDRQSGTFGKDENGRVVCGREFPTLGIRIGPKNMIIQITFTRKELVENNGIAKKKRTVNMDVFKAVRALKHLRESYENEVKKRDDALKKADEIHAYLCVHGMDMSQKDFESATAEIQLLLEKLRLHRTATKARGKKGLEESFAHMEKAAENTGFDRKGQLNAVLAKFIFFKNRYGIWRDREAQGIILYNHERECALREHRDQMLVKLLYGWANELEMQGYRKLGCWKHDIENVAQISEILVMLDNGQYEKALKTIERLGKKLWDVGEDKRAKEYLRKAYVAVKNIRKRDAKKWLLDAKEEIDFGKPWWVAEELEKTHDRYTGGQRVLIEDKPLVDRMQLTIERIKAAVILFYERNQLDRLPNLFRETAQKL